MGSSCACRDIVNTFPVANLLSFIGGNELCVSDMETLRIAILKKGDVGAPVPFWARSLGFPNRFFWAIWDNFDCCEAQWLDAARCEEFQETLVHAVTHACSDDVCRELEKDIAERKE